MRYKHPPNTPRIRTRLHEFVDRGRFSEITRKKYRLAIDQWVLFAGSHPNDWTRRKTEAFRDELIAREMSPVSIAMYMAALRYVSKWHASTDGGTDFAIVQPIDMPSYPKKAITTLNQETTQALLATCVDGRPTLFDLRDLTLLIVGLETGMRSGSLASMTFEKIGPLSRGPDGPYPVALVNMKGRGGKRTYKVPLSDVAMEALNLWQRHVNVRSGPVFRRLVRETDPRTGQTLAKRTPDGISTTSIYKMITKRSKDAGIEHVHPHILRHTFITWRDQDGVRPSVIASVTGHSLKSDAIGNLDIGEMDRYYNKEALGEAGRKTTPVWFASLARRLLREVSR